MISCSDLLGRPEYTRVMVPELTGARVLITGAGGSIGSEIARQVHSHGPASLVLLDRDESALHAVQLSIEGRALLDTDDLVVADIRDSARILRVFCATRPDLVLHTAALKHLTLLEHHPCEAVKTNVWGTLNVLHAAEYVGARVVNISTDKAAAPTCVLGATKRITERLSAGFPRTVSVRFGNVLGSRGSVLDTFRAQVAAGGPVTVTHPDVTRYFMTVEEAVQLVLQAAFVGRHGDVLVLDMGEPVNIASVAQRLIGDLPIDIEYTGLRTGEKLHETLYSAHETPLEIAPQISAVSVEPLHPSAVLGLSLTSPRSDLRSALHALV